MSPASRALERLVENMDADDPFLLKQLHLGSFATFEEAALCSAQSPEGQAAAAERAAPAAPPLTSEETRQQQAEGLTLRMAENTTGYFGVYHKPGHPKPYEAQVRRGGKTVSLGSFANAEEAALCISRTPEGKVAAERPAAAVPLQPSAPQPAPPAIARRAAPPPRWWRSCPGSPCCHRGSPAPGRAWAGRAG